MDPRPRRRVGLARPWPTARSARPWSNSSGAPRRHAWTGARRPGAWPHSGGCPGGPCSRVAAGGRERHTVPGAARAPGRRRTRVSGHPIPSGEPLGSGGEFDVIRALVERWGARARGIGDDAAIVRVPRGDLLVASVDEALEDRHFRAAWLSAREIGYRS